MEQIAQKISEETSKIRRRVRQNTLSYFTAGLGVVAGLAWNEAVKSFIEYVFPFPANSLTAKFVYAVLITVVVSLVVIYLERILKERGEL